MKNLLFALLLLVITICNGQAHLGASISLIKSYHPETTFSVGYMDDGTKYIAAEFPRGDMAYYLDKDGLSYMCMFLMKNMACTNGQIEIYNNKYSIQSTTHWHAYLEGGGIMNINLYYLNNGGYYYFVYTFNNE